MKDRVINGRYEVRMPDHLADWDALSHWERERFASMEKILKEGDVLFDIGAEQGTISGVYAMFVGPENMCLFEPSDEFWPLIKAIWDENDFATPLATYQGFLDAPGSVRVQSKIQIKDWPEAAYGEQITGGMPYKYLHNEKDAEIVQAISIDGFVQRTDIIPTAITIDVEGAEMRVILGARETLKKIRPLVWVSIHPDLMERDYTTTPEDFHDYMKIMGYLSRHLETDHEQHWLFWPVEAPEPPLTSWGTLDD